MTEKNKLNVMNISFNGIIDLKEGLSIERIEEMIENSEEINWEFIEEIGRNGSERNPTRLIGRMKEGNFPTIIIFPSGKFQIMGAKKRKDAKVVLEITIKEIKRRKYRR